MEEGEEAGSASEEDTEEETHLGPLGVEKHLSLSIVLICYWFEELSVLLWRLLKGLSVALALDVQLAVLEPNELEDRDFPRFSELTFFVLFVAVLLQSELSDKRKRPQQRYLLHCF